MQLGRWPSQCMALLPVWYTKHCHHPFLAGLFEIVWPREKLFRKASLLRAVHPPVWYPEAGGGCGCLSLAPSNLFHLQSTLQVFINHPLSPTRQQTGFISPTFTVVEAKAERFPDLPEVRRTSSWVFWVTTPGPHPSDVRTAALSAPLSQRSGSAVLSALSCSRGWRVPCSWKQVSWSYGVI